MFSGIISNIGEVQELETLEFGGRFSLRVNKEVSGIWNLTSRAIKIGESIAINGVCLSVVSYKIEGDFLILLFDLSSETLKKTNLGSLQQFDSVNLERSLQLGDSIDGHFVQGHVDEVGKIKELFWQGETFCLKISHSLELAKFIATKGSISVDGVSLTIGDVFEDSFSAYIVPITFRETIIKNYQINTNVNLEVDCLSRYVARVLEQR
jgi:riboflavin synthase